MTYQLRNHRNDGDNVRLNLAEEDLFADLTRALVRGLEDATGADVPEYSTADLYRRKDRAREADAKLQAHLQAVTAARSSGPKADSRGRILSVREAAEWLGTTPKTLIGRAKDGTGPTVKAGRGMASTYYSQDVHAWGVERGLWAEDGTRLRKRGPA